MSNTEIKFLIAGVGDIARKLGPTWQQYVNQGVRLLASDIIDDPSGKPFLPEGVPFFNVMRTDQLHELLQLSPFQICFLSNYPSVHLATALQFDFFTEHFIFPKPVDSHIQLIRTVKEQKERALQSIASKMLVHDHYRNKPLVARLKSLLSFLHGKYGFVQEIKVYITERRTTGREWRRKGALDDGLILDLAPHALTVLMELFPKRFHWQNEDGDEYERVDVKLAEVVGCYRARDNGCILRDGAESFAVIDLRWEETIDFYPKGENQVLRLDPHYLRTLIVVGKGTSIDNPANQQDLKAIEIVFDGNKIQGNFDTNAVGGVVEGEVVNRLTANVDPRHRGLNLPLQRLGNVAFDFATLSEDAETIIKDFQEFDEAYQIVDILGQALQHDTARTIVLHYAPGIPSSDLINRLVAKGLDTRWQHTGPLSHLVFGRAVEDPID